MRELVSHVGTDYLAFAITAVLVLVVSLVYLFWTERNPSGKLSIPGLDPTDPELGNLGEFTKDGGLHQFLLSNHKKFGPMFSFWWGRELCVSLASPAVWKDIVTLFDRPSNQFMLTEPLFGRKSITYINGDLGRKCRKLLDRHFSATKIKTYQHLLIQIAEELLKKWSTISEGEHVPIRQHFMAASLKSIIRTSYGEDYFKTNKEILQFEEDYELCWEDMEMRLDGDFPEEGSERAKKFDEGLARLRAKIQDIMQHRRAMKSKSSETLLDILLEEDKVFTSDEMILDNAITYIIAGFHTTGNLLTWALYYLCKHPDAMEKLNEELNREVGDSFVGVEDIDKLRYAKQILDETMRCSVLAPYAARYSDFDIIVGGHLIPRKTPMLLALGCVLQDPEIWPEPQRFNPDRFSPELEKARHPLAFAPFGFAGKRKCPGYRFAYYEGLLFLCSVVKNFHVDLVSDKEPSVRHGLVSMPKEEIFVTLKKK